MLEEYMDILTANKAVELSHVKTFIDVLSSTVKISPENFSIMGGHSRRLYMLMNNIPMTDEDKRSWSSSDIDIFCDIKCVLDEKILSFIQRLSDNPDDIPDDVEDIPSKVFDVLALDVAYLSIREPEQLLATVRDKLSKPNAISKLIDNLFRQEVIKFIEDIKMMFSEATEHTLNLSKQHSGINNTYTYETNELVYIGDLFKDLNVENIPKMVECAVSNSSFDDPSFKVSSSHLSFTVPLGKHIQLVFGNHSNTECIDTFDIPQAKFKLDYPYNINQVQCLSDAINFDNFYEVNEFRTRDISPFRLIDRMVKYSNYGFTYTDDVVDKLHNHIDDFVDNNPIQACVTYTSSLY